MNIRLRKSDIDTLSEIFASNLIESYGGEYMGDVVTMYVDNNDYNTLESLIVKIIKDNLENLADETCEKIVDFLL